MGRTIKPPEEGPGSAEFALPREWALKIKRLMGADTHRGKQVVVGPSGLGDPCEVCLAANMAMKLSKHRPAQRISLASWMGTAVHFYMDEWFRTPHMRELFPNFEGESEAPCGEIPGYGKVKGHIDAYDLYKGVGIIADWKIVGANTFKKLKAKGIEGNPRYDYQRQIYGAGIDGLGKQIDYVINFVMLAGSTKPDFSDIIIDIDHYRPEMAKVALDRAGDLWQNYVLAGRQDELISDPDCYSCNGFGSF